MSATTSATAGQRSDYDYTVTQAEHVLGRSDRSIRRYMRDGSLDYIAHADENGFERVFISGASLVECAVGRNLLINWDILSEYTSQQKDLEELRQLAGYPGPRGQARSEEQETSRTTASHSKEEGPGGERSRSRGREIERLVREKDQLRERLDEKDAEIKELYDRLLSETKQSAARFEALFGADRQLVGTYERLSKAMNRDIRRVRQGRLSQHELPLLPELLPQEDGSWRFVDQNSEQGSESEEGRRQAPAVAVVVEEEAPSPEANTAADETTVPAAAPGKKKNTATSGSEKPPQATRRKTKPKKRKHKTSLTAARPRRATKKAKAPANRASASRKKVAAAKRSSAPRKKAKRPSRKPKKGIFSLFRR